LPIPDVFRPDVALGAKSIILIYKHPSEVLNHELTTFTNSKNGDEVNKYTGHSKTKKYNSKIDNHWTRGRN
jgi:hypothetical protein